MNAAAPTPGTTMFAWRKHRGSQTPMRDQIPVPSTPENGYLLKILAAGVCHSDYNIIHGHEQPTYNDKFVMGHEGCGRVVAIGPHVTNTSIKLGDVVAIHMAPGCGTSACPECSRDLPHLCQRADRYGLGQDGCFAQYMAIHERAAVPVPAGVEAAQAAVATDAVLTAYHGIVKRAQVLKGEVVFLFGLGGLGFNALQILLSIGARAIVTDQRAATLEEAVKLGVPREDVVPVGKSVTEFVAENGLVGKIDVVADFVGAEQTVLDGQEIIRRGGRILHVGLMALQAKTNVITCVIKRLTVLYTFAGVAEDLPEIFEMIADKKIIPSVETARLEDFPKILDDLHHGKIRSRMALIPSSIEANI